MLSTGQYRFFSPAIDWGKEDKGTGQPQGATLTSGALTNHPFLEELPPIMLSDKMLTSLQTVHVDGATPGVSVDFPNKTGGKVTMGTAGKKSIRKGGDGTFAVYDDTGKSVKVFGKKMQELMDKMNAQELEEILNDIVMDDAGMTLQDAEPDADDKKKTPSNGDGDSANCSAISPKGDKDKDTMSEQNNKTAVQAVDTTPKKSKAELLSECVSKEGNLDIDAVVQLGTSGAIPLGEISVAVAANNKVADAVKKGVILPRHQGQFLKMALTDAAAFDSYAATAVPAVDLRSLGVSPGPNGADAPAGGDGDRRQFLTLVEQKLVQLRGIGRKADYGDAMNEVGRDNPELYEKYRSASINLSDRPAAKQLTHVTF